MVTGGEQAGHGRLMGLGAVAACHATVVLGLHHQVEAVSALVLVGLVAAGSFAVALAGTGLLRWRWALWGLAMAGAAGLGTVRIQEEVPREAVSVSGIVLESESLGRGGRVTLAEPEVAALGGGKALTLEAPTLRASFKWFEPLPIGAAVSVTARLESPRQPRNPGTVPDSRPPVFARAVDAPHASSRTPSWQTQVAMDLRATLTFENAEATALYRALILGDRSELDATTRAAYQDTGTTHLLAISGMNLAVLGLAVYRIFLALLIRVPPFRRRAQGGRPTAWAAALALVVTAAYTMIIAPSDATDRAMVALAIGFGAVLLRRRASGGQALLVALIGAALLVPDALLRAGFQLSFAATASLVLIAPTVKHWSQRVEAWLPREAAERRRRRWARVALVALGALVITDLATALATAPLTLAWFGQLSVHGLWVNLFAIPLMTLAVFPVGVVWTLVATLCPPLGAWLAPVPEALAELFNGLIRGAGAVAGPASSESWPLVLGVMASLALLMMMTRGRGRLIGGLALAVTTLIAWSWETARPGLTLIAFDVGHGDAVAMRLPDGTRVLFDTGGAVKSRDDNRGLAERVLVPTLRASGWSSIDLLVLTHAHLDHVGAAAALADRMAVRELWIPPCAARSRAVARAIERVEASGGRVRVVGRAMPLVYGGATIEVLGPPRDLEGPGGHCQRKTNDTSLVMRVSYAGRHVLMTGDIEANAERELVRAYPERGTEGSTLRADILKSPHHGSRSSSTEDLLDALVSAGDTGSVGARTATEVAATEAPIALVSGLPGHAPMPPHSIVLDRYRARGMPTFVTGLVGAIKVHIDPDGAIDAGGIESDSHILRPPREAFLAGLADPEDQPEVEPRDGVPVLGEQLPHRLGEGVLDHLARDPAHELGLEPAVLSGHADTDLARQPVARGRARRDEQADEGLDAGAGSEPAEHLEP
ncbi:MAG: DNA internalization-related competence protein ComEC/Rec2, partial [Deltaproteobacteria bacterium]|nr:DNA internalization-related competence protein ComEC/Rec2 [Deltaproteobacteria bacterium]